MNISSVSTFKIPVPAPRGAEWVSAAVDGLARIGRSVWAALELAGYRRAQCHVEMLGLRYPLLSEHTAALVPALRRDDIARESRGTRR